MVIKGSKDAEFIIQLLLNWNLKTLSDEDFVRHFILPILVLTYLFFTAREY